jgi:hypothetical protein
LGELFCFRPSGKTFRRLTKLKIYLKAKSDPAVKMKLFNNRKQYEKATQLAESNHAKKLEKIPNEDGVVQLNVEKVMWGSIIPKIDKKIKNCYLNVSTQQQLAKKYRNLNQ